MYPLFPRVLTVFSALFLLYGMFTVTTCDAGATFAAATSPPAVSEEGAIVLDDSHGDLAPPPPGPKNYLGDVREDAVPEDPDDAGDADYERQRNSAPTLATPPSTTPPRI